MDPVSSIDVLRDLVADQPSDVDDRASLAALAAFTDPDVATAALVEQDILERLAAAKPHLVRRVVTVVADQPSKREDGTAVTGSRLDGSTDCPDCTRGTRSIGGVLVCITLPARVGVLGGTPGDIVACGRER